MTSSLYQLHPKVRVVAETPEDQSHFFGFHDVSPWSPDNRLLLCHRFPTGEETHLIPRGPAELVLWNPEEGTFDTVDTTRAWNWQQGSRLQWAPGSPGKIVFNRDARSGVVGRAVDLESGDKQDFPFPVYDLHPQGNLCLFPNYRNLSENWRSYGYPQLDWGDEPTEPFIGLGNLKEKSSKVLVSLEAVLAFLQESPPPDRQHFLAHPSWSPDGLH